MKELNDKRTDATLTCGTNASISNWVVSDYNSQPQEVISSSSRFLHKYTSTGGGGVNVLNCSLVCSTRLRRDIKLAEDLAVPLAGSGNNL